MEKRPSETFSASETLGFLKHFDKAVEAWIWDKRFRGITSLSDEADAVAEEAAAADDDDADLVKAATFAADSEVDAESVADGCVVGTVVVTVVVTAVAWTGTRSEAAAELASTVPDESRSRPFELGLTRKSFPRRWRHQRRHFPALEAKA